MRRNRQKGSVAVETAVIAVPLIFLALGGIEVGRCMWMFHTLASATKTAVRYAIVHGESCINATSGCASTVGAVSSVLKRNAVGLDTDRVTLTFTAGTNSTQCITLTTCEAQAAAWPPASQNAVGQKITIRANYVFRSVVSGFWPGQTGGTVQLKAQASEVIQF